jgi:hypothetical protein
MAGIAPLAPPPPNKGASSPYFMRVATSPTMLINGHLINISGHTKVARHKSNGHA